MEHVSAQQAFIGMAKNVLIAMIQIVSVVHQIYVILVFLDIILVEMVAQNALIIVKYVVLDLVVIDVFIPIHF
jgi:hypothetical protein